MSRFTIETTYRLPVYRQRSYEANINVISSTRRMLQRTIDILKS